ncbi:MAG: hypothetical protein IJP30_03570 [Clostridia bacterium]|nr:hypothetical protein [Clostridia bacterium]
MSDPQNFKCESSEKPLTQDTFMIDEAYIYTINNTALEKANWQKLTNTAEVYKVEMYTDGEYSINHELDESGMISAKILISKLRHGGVTFK